MGLARLFLPKTCYISRIIICFKGMEEKIEKNRKDIWNIGPNTLT